MMIEKMNEEMKTLIEFIGGFNKWPLLNNDCRKEVIKFLDASSRYKLSFCSKRDRDVVEDVYIDIHYLRFQDNKINEGGWIPIGQDITVDIDFKEYHNHPENIHWTFAQRGEDTVITWDKLVPGKWTPRREMIWKSCNYLEEAVKFTEKWLKRCNYELKKFAMTTSRYPIATSQIKNLRCKDVHIQSMVMDSVYWWLRKVPEQLDFMGLHLMNHLELDNVKVPPELFNEPQVMQAVGLKATSRFSFTNEHLLNSKAKLLGIRCKSMTADGINQFLKRWANGKGVKGFKFAHLNYGRLDETSIKNGLRIRPWDTDFRSEAFEFCEQFENAFGEGNHCQVISNVDPFESLTIRIDICVHIFATGMKMTSDHGNYTQYMYSSDFVSDDYLNN